MVETNSGVIIKSVRFWMRKPYIEPCVDHSRNFGKVIKEVTGLYLFFMEKNYKELSEDINYEPYSRKKMKIQEFILIHTS